MDILLIFSIIGLGLAIFLWGALISTWKRKEITEKWYKTWRNIAVITILFDIAWILIIYWNEFLMYFNLLIIVGILNLVAKIKPPNKSFYSKFFDITILSGIISDSFTGFITALDLVKVFDVSYYFIWGLYLGSLTLSIYLMIQEHVEAIKKIMAKKEEEI